MSKQKKTLVNTETDKNVNEFISSVQNGVRRKDAETLLAIMNDITGKEAKIWGTSIIAYGKYSYQRKNGDEFEWFNVGFSPGKAHLSLYFMFDVNQETELLNQLGPHKCGKGCLYIKKLDQVNLDVLKKLIRKSDRWDRS